MNPARITNLSNAERTILLKLARESVEAAASLNPLPQVETNLLTEKLKADGACFITLYKGKDLRGCTGTLVAQIPLAQEVVRTAAQTARNDPRFFPVTPVEVAAVLIEISVLTPPKKLALGAPSELPKLIRPGIDGVTLYRGRFRATFLPQVWDKIADPVEFLDMLSQKMGLPAKSWTEPGLDAETYQVEEFAEGQVAPGQ